MFKRNILIIAIIGFFIWGAATIVCLCKIRNGISTTPPTTDYVVPVERHEPIGGQRDEHGCLTPGGYSWCEEKQKCLRVWEEACSIEGELKKYLQENISSLSPKKEVLGGKFYITDLRIISSSTAEVSYEDGHISLQAKFNYAYKPGQPSISDFSILPEEK